MFRCAHVMRPARTGRSQYCARAHLSRFSPLTLRLGDLKNCGATKPVGKASNVQSCLLNSISEAIRLLCFPPCEWLCDEFEDAGSSPARPTSRGDIYPPMRSRLGHLQAKVIDQRSDLVMGIDCNEAALSSQIAHSLSKHTDFDAASSAASASSLVLARQPLLKESPRDGKQHMQRRQRIR